MLSRLQFARHFVQQAVIRRSFVQHTAPITKFGPRFPVLRRQYASNPYRPPRRPPRGPSYNRFQQARSLWRTAPEFRVFVTVVGGGIIVWIGSNFEKVPVSGRYRFNCVSEEYEARLGKISYQQTMQEFHGQILRPDDPRHKMVGNVLRRLVPNSGLQGDWEYHVIDDDDEINAFVIPG